VVGGDGACPARASVSRADQISALALRRWGKCAWSLLPSHHRLDRYRLVALTPFRDLFICARDLLIEAMAAFFDMAPRARALSQ
jgi:hypothetical protein